MSEKPALPQESLDKIDELERQYGNLGRPRAPEDHGLSEQPADDFDVALERLGIASVPPFAILPRNLQTAPDIAALVYERESRDLQAIATQAGLTLSALVGNTLATIHENDDTVHLPAIAIAYQVFESVNGTATLIEFFKNILKLYPIKRQGREGQIEVVQEIVIRKNSKSSKFSYKGPAEYYPGIADDLRRRFDDIDG